MIKRHPGEGWLSLFLRVLVMLALIWGCLPPIYVRAAGLFQVNTFADDNSKNNVLSLREALMVANGSLTGYFSDAEKTQLGGCTFGGSSGSWVIAGGCGAGISDTITFLLGNGVIHLSGVLPAISDTASTYVIGPTATGWELAIDGTGLPAGTALLTISSNFNSVSNRIAFINSPSIGLNITGSFNDISSIHFYGNGSYGLQINGGDSNVISETESGFRSLDNPTICNEDTGNGLSNLLITGSAVSNNLNNNTAVCSPGLGIAILGTTAASNNVSYNNIGIWNRPGSLRTLGNTLAGIAVIDGSNNNLITYNNVGGNGAGIWLTGEGTDNNEIHHNSIGRIPLGSIPNTLSGIVIGGGAQSNQVHDNTISMNSVSGVVISDTVANNTVVENNTIYSNVSHGIVLSGDTTGNTIRGNNIFNNGEGGIHLADTVYGNLVETGSIHNNTGAGIVQESTAGPNLWRNLSIYANGGLGIDRLANGVPDGPYPTITGIAPAGGGGLVISGVAQLSTNVELYRSDRDPSGFGEGRTRVGSTSTDGTGHWSITITDSSGCFTALQARSTVDGPDASEFGPNTSCLFLPMIVK